MKYIALFEDTVGHQGFVEIDGVENFDDAVKKAVKSVFIGAENVNDTIDALVESYGKNFKCEFHLKSLMVLEISNVKDIDLATVTKAFNAKLKKKQEKC